MHLQPSWWLPSRSVPLDTGDVGHRVVIRSLVHGHTGPSGGPAMTDVVGVLQAYDGTTAEVVRRDGTPVAVPVADIVSAKRVPAAAGRRISSEDLQRICAEGWPAPVSEPLGEWVLRAAGGFTGRANSVLVAGDPGVPSAQALAHVVGFYQRHVLPPRAQVVAGSAWADGFAASGWQPMAGPRGGAEVMVARLRGGPSPREEVVLNEHTDDAWMRLYNRASGHDAALVRRLLEGPDDVAFARVGDPPVAIGRMVVTGAWAGLSAVEVDAAHRRRGIGSAVVDALVAWAAGRGARWCYLQVTEDNVGALALWHRYGFREHHAYRYLVPQGLADPLRPPAT